MINFRIAVKSFIINDENKLLLLKSTINIINIFIYKLPHLYTKVIHNG